MKRFFVTTIVVLSALTLLAFAGKGSILALVLKVTGRA